MTKYVIQQSVFATVSGSDCLTVAPYAQITITDSESGDPADLWADVDGDDPISGNVVIADETGFFAVYADSGTYDIAILSGSVTHTLHDVVVGGSGSGLSGGFNYVVQDELELLALPVTEADLYKTAWMADPRAGVVLTSLPLSETSWQFIGDYINSIDSGIGGGGDPYFDINFYSGRSYRAYLGDAAEPAGTMLQHLQDYHHIHSGFLWANRPPPAQYNGERWAIFDSWANGALAISDGTIWRIDRPITIYANSPSDSITGVTVLTALRNVLVPGGLIGKNGHVHIDPIFRYTSNANAKNAGYRISQGGGVVSGKHMWQHSQSNSSTSSLPLIFSNDNSVTAQVAATLGATNGSVGQSTSATEATAAVNTDSDFYITITAAPASASDTVTLRRLMVTIFPVYD